MPKVPPSQPAKKPRRKARVPNPAAAEIYKLLLEHYPDAHCELDHANAYQLTVATILSAQCTDQRVNMVTPALFRRYPTPADLAAANPEELEDLIRSTGFFRNKRKSLMGMANAVVDEHKGRVPDEMEDLVKLPGVGRKTANVVLGNAFGKNEGVVVDTHVSRLSSRLAFTREVTPEKIELDLMKLFPRDSWTMLAHLLIWHGRRICTARNPKCASCFLVELCPSAFKV